MPIRNVPTVRKKREKEPNPQGPTAGWSLGGSMAGQETSEPK